jgi:outer membrane protein assembly factor BamB
MAAGFVGTIGRRAAVAAWCLAICGLACPGPAPPAGWAAPPDAEADDEAGGDTGVYVPTDRQQERLLDRARRLVGDAQWSDAATLLDEILGAEQDSFFRRPADRDGAARRTWASVKSEAARQISALPPAGREAYQLQFRARADRLLAAAVAANDAPAILAVARRWFATPAGQRAALLAAVDALESNQPLSAAAWLDRLDSTDAALAPTLAVMQAMARERAGDPAAATAILEKARTSSRAAARIGGRDVTLSFPPGRGLEWLRDVAGQPGRPAGGAEWWQPRGNAGRNAVAVASRPLLVPRYRVPLARHPEEARRLEAMRRECADRGAAAYPAGAPLAVAGTILVRAPLGLLAIDFASGKRTWLQPGPRAAGDDESGPEVVARTFDDFTGGGISSDGRLVFVVESHPDVLAARAAAANPFAVPQREAAWQGGNHLAAYDVTDHGRPAWRLPARKDGAVGRGGPLESTTWFVGGPLVVGDRLYVVVEERAELRLDVLQAADGRTVWSQPLAELDESRAITSREAVARRLAGGAPALGDGVLVCPLGAGAVVAVDLANRTLLWAHDYARSPPAGGDAGGNGMRLRAFPPGLRPVDAGDGPAGMPRAGWCDDGPVVADGRVLLTPHDSAEVHCLDVRTGAVRWKLPREGRLHVAGVVGGRVIVVARDGVEALDLDTGRQFWRRAFEAGVAPSGRGILTADRLFLPLDAPEVVEIALADGTVAGRSPARGGAVPGNLVAYRGEVISLGVDTVDVFHQAAALEARVETAAREQPGDSWAAIWGAQLALDRGDPRIGLARLRAALAADPRQPPDTLAAALAFALRRDFAAVAPRWRDALPPAGLSPAARTLVRGIVDGCLAGGDLPEAWSAWRELFARAGDAESTPAQDAGDPRCLVTEHRWLRGRLERLRRQAGDPLRAEIDTFLAAALTDAVAATETGTRQRALEALVDTAGRLPAGMEARGRLAAELAGVLEAAVEGAEAMRPLAVRREFLLLDLAAADLPGRDAARAAIASIRDRLVPAGGGSTAEAEPGSGWPLGRVKVRRTVAERAGPADETRARLVPLAIEQAAEPFVPGLAAACDAQQSRLAFIDRFGRRLGDGVTVNDDGRAGIPLFDQATVAASALGRVVFVRSGGAVTALELTGRGPRRMWTTAGADASASAGRFRMAPPLIPRNGAVPLGMRIDEPGDAAAAAVVWGRPVTGGLPLLRGRTLVVLDPVTGAVLWERHRLPPATDLFNDEDVVCVVTTDGRRSPVLSLADGRILHEVDLPDRRLRLLAHGGRVLAVAGIEAPPEGRVADSVRLEVVDVADRTTVPLGEFPGTARAAGFGPGMLAVVDGDGWLVVVDLAARAVAFRTRLPEMPRAIDHLEVRAWEDRLLVCVGSRDAGGGPEAGDQHAVTPLQQMLIAGIATQPLGYSVWAVDRETGRPLWTVPATASRHCLLAGQPAGLPVLVFARQIQRNHDRGSTFLSVLCLDKRTGHAVLEDDRIPAQPHLLFGCDVVGDPDRHTITVREHGGDPQRVTLEFTGGPMPPRPPHQAGRPVKADGLVDDVRRLLESLLPERGE